MKRSLEEILLEHREAVDRSFTPDQVALLEKIARIILDTFETGHKIFLCGNGGSAADCQHIAAEFIARFKLERRSLPAIALTTDTSILTAISNDYSYERVFSRQIEGLGQKGDVLIALSTSGNSANVLEAVSAASKLGMKTIGLSGGDGGKLRKAADTCFCARTDKTPHIQEIHITSLHAISEIVEDLMFGE